MWSSPIQGSAHPRILSPHSGVQLPPFLVTKFMESMLTGPHGVNRDRHHARSLTSNRLHAHEERGSGSLLRCCGWTGDVSARNTPPVTNVFKLVALCGFFPPRPSVPPQQLRGHIGHREEIDPIDRSGDYRPRLGLFSPSVLRATRPEGQIRFFCTNYNKE
jgi:hypothetical protein